MIESYGFEIGLLFKPCIYRLIANQFYRIRTISSCYKVNNTI